MANNQFISPLQITSAKSWSGLTEYNSLTNIFANKPHEMGAVMSSHFGYNYGNFINLLTGGLGNVMKVTSEEVRWDLHGQNERAIEVMSNLESGNTTPGYGKSMIRVILAEQFFAHSDVLVSDSGVQVRVSGDPEPYNGGWLYRVQLASGASSDFLDPNDIAAGAKFSKDYSTVGEYSERGGGTSYTAPMKIRNKLTTLRKEYTFTGTAAASPMAIKLYSPDGKKTFDMWAPLAQITAMQQFYTEIDKSLVYQLYTGQPDETIKDENGRPVIQGAGLRQQIAPANVRYYTSLSYNFLMDFFTSLSFVATPLGGNNKFVMLTGKMGMIEFDRAIRTEFNGSGLVITNEGRFVTGSGMDLTFGSQFTTVKFPNGIEVTVTNFPPYDDIVRNRTIHPVSGYPVESYRFTVLNIGTDGEGKANIQKVVREGREMMMWSVGGSIDINGKARTSFSASASNALDGAVGHMISECGLVIKDPTRCGELILNIN